MAAQTRRITLGTGVLNMPFYNPLVLARRLATLDVLSGGRLRVGLGQAWSIDELEAVGVDPKERAARADEFVRALKAIWTTDPVELEGPYFRVAPSIVGLKPAQKPHPPIYLAGFVRATLARAATLGDGWLPSSLPLPVLAQLIPQFRTLARAAGRDLDALEVIIMNPVHITPASLDEATRGLLSGGADQVRADLHRLQELGVTEVIAWGAADTIDQAVSEIEDLWSVAEGAPRIPARPAPGRRASEGPGDDRSAATPARAAGRARGSAQALPIFREREDAMTSVDAPTTGLTLRAGTPQDAAVIGRICHLAFTEIGERHGFPSDFPTPEVGVGLASTFLADPGIYCAVVEADGRLIGSNFLDQRDQLAGVGPITIDPGAQNRGVGRLLMQHVLDRAAASGAVGVRLVQAAYHTRSLSLYATLGFRVREPLACLQGAPSGLSVPGRRVRWATLADVASCNAVCRQVHGHDRGGELASAIAQGTARVVERDGRISGYASALAYFGHAVGETVEDVEALIGAADALGGPGILVPLRDAALFRWCLEQGLRVVQVMNLMTVGFYQEPRGAYLPSVSY